MAGLSSQCTTCPLTADIHEQNATFVICAADRMPSKLCILKELLIKTLFSLASKPTDSMFNIVSCASKVLKWQNTLVRCSLPRVAEAAAWIRALECETGGTSVPSAVAVALEDSNCQAAYLFTSGLPECTTEEICSLLKGARQALPLHTVYLVENEGGNKTSSQGILEKIAKESGGSFQMISFDSDDTEDQDVLLSCIHSHSWGTWSLDFPHGWLSSSAKEDGVGSFSNTNNLPRGVRVLARKKADGYFYLGHIVQHVKGSREHVLIEFERSKKSPKAQAEFRMQETPLCDVLHHEDARWRPVAPGDKVLAPWKKKGEQYGPGTVLQVTEAGLSHSAFKNSEVLVNFWNGLTKKVPADIAVRIPLPLSERIILELQMPLAARQMLVEQNPDYPYTVPPGYRASGSCWQNHSYCFCGSCASKVPHVSAPCCFPHMSPWHFCHSAWEHLGSPITLTQPESDLIPGTSMTKEELNRKVEEQLSRGSLPVLEGSENEESRKPKEEENLADLTSCKELASQVTMPCQTHQKENASEGLREGPGIMVDAAVNTDKCIPWQKQKVFPRPDKNETSSRPFHQNAPRKHFVAGNTQVHSTFGWVDQSLKEDRSAIESVLHMRRSYSAPAIQRLAVEVASPDSPKEATRVEFKRQRREQRQLKEEQRRQEECIQKELLRDKKRHRSLQRSSQGLLKQQESCEQAWQRLARLQVARAERVRQESCLQEAEKNEESQRLEFLKAQKKHRDQLLKEYNQRVDDRENKKLEQLQNRIQSVQKDLKAAKKAQDTKEKEKAAAKWKECQKRASQREEKKRQETQDLQQYLREQGLLTLRASLLP